MYQPKVLTYKTIREAYYDVPKAFFENRLINGVPITDGFARMKAWGNDVSIHVTDPTSDIDLREVGFTPRRWAKFLKDYTHPTTFSSFYARLLQADEGQEIGYSTPVNLPHNLGNCIMGISVRFGKKRTAFPRTGRVKLMTRTTMWAPTGVLDLSLGAALIDALRRDVPNLGQIDLVWDCAQIQIHALKTMPFMSWPEIVESARANPDTPASTIVLEQLDGIQKVLNSGYRTGIRSAEKYLEMKSGVWKYPMGSGIPSLPSSYLHGALTETSETITAEGIAGETSLPLVKVLLVLKQMGLLIRKTSKVQYLRADTRVIRAMDRCRERAVEEGHVSVPAATPAGPEDDWHEEDDF